MEAWLDDKALHEVLPDSKRIEILTNPEESFGFLQRHDRAASEISHQRDHLVSGGVRRARPGAVSGTIFQIDRALASAVASASITEETSPTLCLSSRWGTAAG